MYGLHIYLSLVSVDTPTGERVFYCQRDGGPPYMWRDERGLDQWHYTRVHPSDWKPHSLRHSSLKEMPLALQAKLDAHYLS